MWTLEEYVDQSNLWNPALHIIILGPCIFCVFSGSTKNGMLWRLDMRLVISTELVCRSGL